MSVHNQGPVVWTIGGSHSFIGAEASHPQQGQLSTSLLSPDVPGLSARQEKQRKRERERERERAREKAVSLNWGSFRLVGVLITGALPRAHEFWRLSEGREGKIGRESERVWAAGEWIMGHGDWCGGFCGNDCADKPIHYLLSLIRWLGNPSGLEGLALAFLFLKGIVTPGGLDVRCAELPSPSIGC